MILLANSLGFPNMLFEADNHNSGKQQFEDLITILMVFSPQWMHAVTRTTTDTKAHANGTATET